MMWSDREDFEVKKPQWMGEYRPVFGILAILH